MTKAEKEKINENKIKNGMNIKLKEKKILNDEFDPTYKKRNNNLTSVLSIRRSFFYTKKINSNTFKK